MAKENLRAVIERNMGRPRSIFCAQVEWI